MKIINVSAKVIGILGKDMMPDSSLDVNEDIIKNESVKALIDMGLLRLENSIEERAALKEELKKEILAEMSEDKAPEEKPKTRGRKPKAVEGEKEESNAEDSAET